MDITLFYQKVAADRAAPKLCGYKGCTEPLPPRVDGERHKIGGKEVCDDCYYNAFDALGRFPIGSRGRRRRA